MSTMENLAGRYAQRRERLAAHIGEGLAVINSGGVAPDPLLYDKNLYYLTGVTDKEAVLVLAPAGFVVDLWRRSRGRRWDEGGR